MDPPPRPQRRRATAVPVAPEVRIISRRQRRTQTRSFVQRTFAIRWVTTADWPVVRLTIGEFEKRSVCRFRVF